MSEIQGAPSPLTPAAATPVAPRRESLGRSPDTVGSAGRNSQPQSRGSSRNNSRGKLIGGDHRDRRSLLARMQDEDDAYGDWAGCDDLDADASSWSSRGSKGKRSGTKSVFKLRTPPAGTSPGSASGGYLVGSVPQHRSVQTVGGRGAGGAGAMRVPAGAGADDEDEDFELALALSRSLMDLGSGGAASTSGGGGGGGGGGGVGGRAASAAGGIGEGRAFGEEDFPASTSAPTGAAHGGRPPLPGRGLGGPPPGEPRRSPGGAWVSAPRIPRSREGDMSYEALVELEDVRTTAPPEVVDALPLRTAGDADEEVAEKLCPICQELFSGGDEILELPHCKHLLHRECGREWLLQYSRRCPTCKASVMPK